MRWVKVPGVDHYGVGNGRDVVGHVIAERNIDGYDSDGGVVAKPLSVARSIMMATTMTVMQCIMAALAGPSAMSSSNVH